MTSFFSYWYSRVTLVFKEFMHRYCRVRRIHSMLRPLSNIALLNIFDSAFHFFISRAARDATTFHFEFDSAFHLRWKVPSISSRLGRNCRGKKISRILQTLAKFAEINSFSDLRKCRFAKFNSREIFQELMKCI